MNLIKREISIPQELKSLDGIRILHMSDLHLRGRNIKIERFIDMLSHLNFDLLFITGDLIDSDEGIEWACRYLRRLRPAYGSWFALGNHDEYEIELKHLFLHDRLKNKTKKNNLKRLFAALKSIQVKALLDKADRINISSSTIRIFGVTAPFSIDRYAPYHLKFSSEIKKLRGIFSRETKKKNEFLIVLTHVPDMLFLVGNMHADLYLAGHTHGGQVRLPFIGPVIAFSKFQRKYNKGLYRMPDNSFLNVSAGLSQSRETPIRFLCPGEASLITLWQNI